MHRFRFRWKDGRTEDGFGKDVVEAYKSLGYSPTLVYNLEYILDLGKSETGEGEQTWRTTTRSLAL